jgi:hypothetical protein
MKILVGLLVSLWLCSIIKADTIYFKNGNKIHGKVLYGGFINSLNLIEVSDVYGRKHFIKPGKMRVIFKDSSWLEFSTNTVKCAGIDDLNEFEWRREGHFIIPSKDRGTIEWTPGEVKPPSNADHTIKIEAKIQVKIESSNP